MTFHSPQFFVLFPCVFLLYFCSPVRFRNSILLATSERRTCYVAGILLVPNGLGTGDSAFIYFQF